MMNPRMREGPKPRTASTAKVNVKLVEKLEVELVTPVCFDYETVDGRSKSLCLTSKDPDWACVQAAMYVQYGENPWKREKGLFYD